MLRLPRCPWSPCRLHDCHVKATYTSRQGVEFMAEDEAGQINWGKFTALRTKALCCYLARQWYR